MKDDSKLADLLRVEWRELLDQKMALERRMNAIDLLLGGTADADGEDEAPVVEEAPKKKRARRTNAQIAADKAAESRNVTHPDPDGDNTVRHVRLGEQPIETTGEEAAQ